MATHSTNRRYGFQTRAIHHGYNPSTMHGSVAPPIFMTSTYAFDSLAESDAIRAHEREGYLYGREANPTQALLETRLADLEGAEAGIVFASGMAAAGSLFLSLLSQGDELVVHRTLYANTFSLTRDGLPRFGIKVVPVDLTDPSALARALTPRTKLVYFETPVNPTAEILDIAAIAERAHAVGARVVIDSTFASPAVQRPLEHGADLVLHSLTKYINGHGDLLAGAVLGDAATVERIRSVGLRYITGATLSPMAAFLVLRGLKTLKLRMQHHAANAQAIAEMLAAHPAVARVQYPHLSGAQGYAVARKQMANGSAMMSLELRSGYDGAVRMIDRLQLISRAVSLGDVDSLIMHPGSAVTARRKIDPTARLADGVNMELIRLSVGLEELEDLLDDLGQALEGA
jgi:methionine-gamma-lyase